MSDAGDLVDYFKEKEIGVEEAVNQMIKVLSSIISSNENLEEEKSDLTQIVKALTANIIIMKESHKRARNHEFLSF